MNDSLASSESSGASGASFSDGTQHTAMNEPIGQTHADAFSGELMKEGESSTSEKNELKSPSSLSDPDLWENTSPLLSKKGVVEFNEGDARVMIMKDDTRLVPVVRNEEEMFTQTAMNASTADDLDAVVNAQQYELEPCFYLDYLIGSDAVDPECMTPQGQVIENGNVIAGRTSPNTFYVSQNIDASGDVNNNYGFGDPPADATIAFGGGLPIIIDGLRYNDVNVYAPGTSEKAPSSGDPGEYRDNLQMRSNNGYAAFVNEYERALGNFDTGKVVIAHSSSNNALAVVVQPDGAANGISLSDLRDRLSDAGFDNAIAFDGSSSATLVKNGQNEIEPAQNKNQTITTGIGFRINDGQSEAESAPGKDETGNLGIDFGGRSN